MKLLMVIPAGLATNVGRAPLNGKHPGRLAVEQLYGYMTRNSKQLGILTTLKGWCFLKRANGGQLFMTRMFGDFGVSREGYRVGTERSCVIPIWNFCHEIRLMFLDKFTHPTRSRIPQSLAPGYYYDTYLHLKSLYPRQVTI